MSEDGVESLCSCLKQFCHTSNNAHYKNCEGSPFTFVIHAVSSACIIRNTSPEALNSDLKSYKKQLSSTVKLYTANIILPRKVFSVVPENSSSIIVRALLCRKNPVLLVFLFSRKKIAKVLAVHVVSSRTYCPKNARKLLRYSTSIFLSRMLPSKYLQVLRTQYESRKLSQTYGKLKLHAYSPTTLLSRKRWQ